MRVSRISIKNILGVEALEIEPGKLVQISGANGTGKTSVLDAIRAALSGGHDATLLRQGASEGEVVLILEDGVQIERRITADKSDTVVRHPTFGKISKPAQYLKKLADALSLNPVEFLTAPEKDRVNILLEAIPMQVTADQLREIPAIALTGIDLDKHALTVIGLIGRSLYDLRTGVNRAAKEKAATAKQMTETLPEGAPEGDWGQVLDAALAESSSLQCETRTKLDAINKELKAYQDAAEHECSLHCEQVRNELEQAIEKLRADSQIEIDRSRESRDQAFKKFGDAAKERIAAEEQIYRPKEAELKEKIGHARAMVEQHTKAETTRTFIGQLNEEAGKLDAEASKLTHALGRLEILKSNLLEKLPIEGLEVRDGDIYLGGLPFDRVNESKRIRLAIEIAKLRAGSLGLVAVDGLERLDPKTFASFKKEAAKSGLQFVIAHVSDGPLAIESEVA